MLAWINGIAVDQLSIRDRGLAYGDGVFETLMVRNGQPRLYQRHLERLALGCQRLAIPIALQEVSAELLLFAEQARTALVKLMITRGQGVRGYAPPQTVEPVRILHSQPAPYYSSEYSRSGINLYPCTLRLSEQPRLAGIKHLNRLEQVLARAEWQDEQYAEGLLCDAQERVIEGVFSNLFMVSDGVLYTPDVSRTGIAGVMRAEIIARAQALQIDCRIVDIRHADLLAADEVFYCNSLYGIWPVRTLAEVVWPLGPITRLLQADLSALLGNT